jgi:predicted ester cyclase
MATSPKFCIYGAGAVGGMIADGDRVTTYETYYGTHDGSFLGIAPTHRKIRFESVDVMRVQNGKITEHWGVGNLLSLMQQIGGWTPSAEA